MITVQIDEETLLEMLMDRLRAWTHDSDDIDLFNQYYENRVYSGCFDGAELDIMSIVDNDWVNNLSIMVRAEYEKERTEYIETRFNEEIASGEFTKKEQKALRQEIEEETPTWDDLECGEHNLEFLSGYYIEAKNENELLIS